MVERDEGSRNGKRNNGTDRKQQSPPTFVNHFAKYMESKVSYAEALRLGHTNLEILRLNSALGGSGTITAVPFQSDGNLSRSYSTPSFDSSAPSTPSLPHSISSPDLESQDSPTENDNNNSSSAHDFPNSSFSSATTEPSSNPSASINPLYFGKLKSCLSLPQSFPYQFSSTCTDLKTTSNGKLPPPPPPPYSPSRVSNSGIVREELQRLIKRAMESGNFQRQCANCGNSQHCCGQTILEAVSSIPPAP
ncbi:hypothetical protein HS088_TW08G00763 [Tripterygium wilfordii]|uniref:Uncharacterized protein n=1 Tax=Tripterygium wilfordii TaxID=458696 RepID=A0A7J7DCU2_TRIWF|nr:uncharacterized protein LOC120003921 [Tripterygium wilfordii]KAF5744167.1 hypothetical protein HS088_TW08G00763 [Tripterygium wilfordii]